jgi:hypothetical protein
MSDDVTPGQRRTTMGGIAFSTVVTAALWYALYRFLPAPADAQPLETAFACSAIAGLLTLMAGVEAVAHERLVTPAIDPLAGFETQRMRVNQRYLQNTLEQFVIFAAGLLALSAYAPPRMLIILTIVWVLMRWAFWIGYHRSPLLRGWGAPGMIQSMLVLLFVTYRFAADAYGPAVGIAITALFGLIEAVLFRAVLRRAQ